MLRDGRLMGLKCDGTDRCGLTEAVGDVGVGGVGHGRGESNPKRMVVKVLLAYGPDCDWSMAWLAGSRLAVRSARKARCDAKAAGRCHPRPGSRCSRSSCVGGALP